MRVNIQKQGRGFPLVLFHGWGFDHHVWGPLVWQLHDDYTLYCVDLPGFGRSPMMPWEAFKSELLNTLPASFGVLGWSLGGLWAMRLAAEEPHRVRALMTVGASPRFIQSKDWPGIQESTFEQFMGNLTANPQKTIQDFVALQQKNAGLMLPEGLAPTQEGLKNGLFHLKTWDLRSHLTAMRAPCQMLFGRLDAIVPIAVMSHIQNICPHIECIAFSHAAHMPFLSHLEAFQSHLRSFFI